MISVEVYPDEFLRLVRGRLEMTQAELARKLGIARGSLCRYEIGESSIPPAMMEAIKRIASER